MQPPPEREQPPMPVFHVCAAGLLVLLTFLYTVLPVVQQVYDRQGIALSQATELAYDAANLMRQHDLLLGLSVMLAAVAADVRLNPARRRKLAKLALAAFTALVCGLMIELCLPLIQTS